MTKRKLCLVALVAVCLALLFGGTQTATASSLAGGECGENVSWTLDKSGILTISGTGKMDNYAEVDFSPQWADFAEQINLIVVEDGVTSIGDLAFEYCNNVTDVVLPSSLTSIGYYAFSECHSLTDLYIPDSVTEIGPCAFYECRNLRSIRLPASITCIRDSTFADCHCLSNVEIPNSVESIEQFAFERCYSLTNVVIPESVTYIDSFVFKDCRSLISVVIPGYDTDIKGSAFDNCPKFTIYSPVKTDAFFLANDPNIEWKDIADFTSGKSAVVIPSFVSFSNGEAKFSGYNENHKEQHFRTYDFPKGSGYDLILAYVDELVESNSDFRITYMDDDYRESGVVRYGLTYEGDADVGETFTMISCKANVIIEYYEREGEEPRAYVRASLGIEFEDGNV